MGKGQTRIITVHVLWLSLGIFHQFHLSPPTSFMRKNLFKIGCSCGGIILKYNDLDSMAVVPTHICSYVEFRVSFHPLSILYKNAQPAACLPSFSLHHLSKIQIIEKSTTTSSSHILLTTHTKIETHQQIHATRRWMYLPVLDVEISFVQHRLALSFIIEYIQLPSHFPNSCVSPPLTSTA